MKKKLTALLLAMTMVLSLGACGGCQSGNQGGTAGGKDSAQSGNGNAVAVQTASQFAGGSIYELKQMYGVEDALELKPFYNVEQGTAFTFHFNSYVKPHTTKVACFSRKPENYAK